ncbi:hypothetical protein FJ872_32995 [Mesorhizobium sp. B2-5-9]|uniref:phage adaptor protein n=1 Tax=Mesorhizobium sp. B2-5-9 TaxID=2589921 RepID=UPI00112AAD9E|nr:hypothetical protein [Mesorhizobium sp. B2-5-9]TPJ95596.1 hypothetical protein FJ872_32995 [Mesorhizobium sp. B2-5-9]
MSVLTVIQSAATVLGMNVPDAVFSVTSRDMVEVQRAVNRAARMVRDEYDWQALKKIATMTGDGSTEDFSLPVDYARMPKQTRLWPSAQPNNPLVHVLSEDKWLQLTVENFSVVSSGMWTLYGGQIHIKAAPTGTIQYFYVSNAAVMPTAGDPKAQFSADSDSFVLDEYLLELCFIWSWKKAKGIAYDAELAEYEDARDRLVGDDKGARILAIGTPRYRFDADIAYPLSISEA